MTLSKVPLCWVSCIPSAENKFFIPSVVMLNVVMLSVVMQSVVAPPWATLACAVCMTLIRKFTERKTK